MEKTVFGVAVLKRDEGQLRELLKHGVPEAEINAMDAHGNTPLNFLCAMVRAAAAVARVARRPSRLTPRPRASPRTFC